MYCHCGEKLEGIWKARIEWCSINWIEGNSIKLSRKCDAGARVTKQEKVERILSKEKGGVHSEVKYRK